MAIYVTGDTHGPRSIGFHSVDGYMPRLNTSAFPEQRDLGKEDYVIICGDFGGIWDTDRVAFQESSEERNGLDWLEGKPFTTLFVPGNHENYDRLTGIRDERILGSWLYEKMPLSEKQRLREGYPRMEWHGGSVRQIRPSVLMLEPGVFDLGGIKVFAYGGAASHDISGGILNPADYADKKAYKEAFDKAYRRGISFRVKGISWWEQEQPDRAKEEDALSALSANAWKVDFILSHDCAASDRILLGYGTELTRLNRFLEEVKQKTGYRHWFFGHLHDNRNLPGGREHLLYEQIIQVA